MCTAPAQACSILYKTKLPLILVFNKCDVQSYEFAVEWMKVCPACLSFAHCIACLCQFGDYDDSSIAAGHYLMCPASSPSLIHSSALQDYETFHEALEEDSSYASSLAKSLSLVLDEFYQNLRTVRCSRHALRQPAMQFTCEDGIFACFLGWPAKLRTCSSCHSILCCVPGPGVWMSLVVAAVLQKTFCSRVGASAGLQSAHQQEMPGCIGGRVGAVWRGHGRLL